MRVLRAVKAHLDAGFKVFLSGFQNSPIENNMYFCYLGLLVKPVKALGYQVL